MPKARVIATVGALFLLVGCGDAQPAKVAADGSYNCIVGINVNREDTDPSAVLKQLRKTCAKLRAARPAALPSAAAGSRAAEGRRLVTTAKCEACHRIGEAGNSGPGPDLTGIRDRLPAAAITRAMVNPVAPMPSFASFGPSGVRAITAYLRSVPPR